ncbi:hypothetical protein CBR65_02460 [Cellvibrio sp. PSBB006]|nr:hypothetical protein CBR65_02460 [Cellvibrio sp. PSBB006]
MTCWSNTDGSERICKDREAIVIFYKTLRDFMNDENWNALNLASYAAECGAYFLVEQDSDFCFTGQEFFTWYKFKDEFCGKLEDIYRVIYMPGVSYLLHDVDDTSSIWLCYTRNLLFVSIPLTILSAIIVPYFTAILTF